MMRLSKRGFPLVPGDQGLYQFCRRSVAVFGLALLAACSGAGGPQRTDLPASFDGAVAADEPRAALVGRDILARGGTAGDAAVAVALALAVTKPAAASLGAGGVCLVHDPREKQARVVDFQPRDPAGGGDEPKVAIPAMLRGLLAVHASQGILRWEQLVGPAENLARFPQPLSRASAADFQGAADELADDMEAWRLFYRDNLIIGEGETVEQPDLAAMLSLVRTRGALDFYTGVAARRFVAGVTAAGGDLTAEALAAYRPAIREAPAAPVEGNEILFAPAYGSAAPYQAALWALLQTKDRYADARATERPHLLVDAEVRAYAAYGTTDGYLTPARLAGALAGYDPAQRSPAAALVPNPGTPTPETSGTGFVTVDRRGGAVACGLTLNKPFGLGRLARATGIFPAVRAEAGAESTALSPLMVIHRNSRGFLLALAGSGIGAPTVEVAMAAAITLAGRPLNSAMEAARVYHPGVFDEVLVEQGLDADTAEALGSRRYEIRPIGDIARVNAVSCPRGLPLTPQSCTARTDPRGIGLGASPGR